MTIAAHTIDIVTRGSNTAVYANSIGATQNVASADMEIHMMGATNVTS